MSVLGPLTSQGLFFDPFLPIYSECRFGQGPIHGEVRGDGGIEYFKLVGCLSKRKARGESAFVERARAGAPKLLAQSAHRLDPSKWGGFP